MLIRLTIYFLLILHLVFPTFLIASSETQYPLTIGKNVSSTLAVHFGEKNRCSAVRVAEGLILSAAHCVVGYDGKSKRPNSIYFGIREVSHPLEVLEIGRFVPSQGKMEDWVLLTPKKGETLPSSITIAPFPKKEEIKKILKDLGNFDGEPKGAPVWAITYPFTLVRTFPREGFDGKGPFVSKGHLKSDTAYKKYILFVGKRFQFCDEQNHLPCPKLDIDVEKEWEQLGNPLVNELHKTYQSYKDSGDPLLYHTADYSNGSSGGGLFIEGSGNFLGMTPFGSNVGPRKATFNGVGQLYRIDVVCRQSKILSKLEKCQELVQ